MSRPRALFQLGDTRRGGVREAQGFVDEAQRSTGVATPTLYLRYRHLT